jgi:predicted RNA-binding protein with PIN domain
MSLTLVDGYNLLHASGVFGATRGARGLESSRTALLDHVADLVGETAPRVLFVFDAAKAPDGLPGKIVHRGIRVWFAREYPDADSLIEEILEEERSPASITVVSNDRRLQLAARRRGAAAISSDAWLADLRRPRKAADPGADKPPEPGPGEVEHWKRHFGLDSE